MTTIWRGAGAGLIMAAVLATGVPAQEDAEKSRLERAAENCKEQLKSTFSLEEETEVEIDNTARYSRDRTFMTATIDVPGAGPRQIRCQVNDRGDGIRRLRVFDEDLEDNNGWAEVDDLARRAETAAAARDARKAAEAAAAEAAAGAGAETGTGEDAAEGAGEGGNAGLGEAGPAPDEDTAVLAPADPELGSPDAPEATSPTDGGAGEGAESAEAEEPEVPSGPVFKSVN